MFIDRAIDIDVADPEYYTKYVRYLNQKAFYENDNATIPDFDAIPERNVVRPEYDDVFEDSNWWVSLHPAGDPHLGDADSALCACAKSSTRVVEASGRQSCNVHQSSRNIWHGTVTLDAVCQN